MKKTNIDTTVAGEFDLERSDLEATIPLLLDQIGATAQARAGGDPATELAITQGLQSQLLPKALQSVEARLKESAGFASRKAGQASRQQKDLQLKQMSREMDSKAWESAKKKRMAAAGIAGVSTLGAKALGDWEKTKEKFGGLGSLPWSIGPGDIGDDQINAWREEYIGLPPVMGRTPSFDLGEPSESLSFPAEPPPPSWVGTLESPMRDFPWAGEPKTASAPLPKVMEQIEPVSQRPQARDREAVNLINSFAADKRLLESVLDLPLVSSLIDDDPSVLSQDILGDPDAMMSLYADTNRRALLGEKETQDIEYLLDQMN